MTSAEEARTGGEHAVVRKAPYDLYFEADAEHPDDPAARSFRYLALMIEHGYIEELEQAVPTLPEHRVVDDDLRYQVAHDIWSHTGSEEDGCCSTSYHPCDPCMKSIYLPAADVVLATVADHQRPVEPAIPSGKSEPIHKPRKKHTVPTTARDRRQAVIKDMLRETAEKVAALASDPESPLAPLPSDVVWDEMTCTCPPPDGDDPECEFHGHG